MANVDMGAAKRIIYMLTNFYPERMVRCLVGWCRHLCFGALVAGVLVLGAVLDNADDGLHVSHEPIPCHPLPRPTNLAVNVVSGAGTVLVGGRSTIIFGSVGSDTAVAIAQDTGMCMCVCGYRSVCVCVCVPIAQDTGIKSMPNPTLSFYSVTLSAATACHLVCRTCRNCCAHAHRWAL